MRILTNLLDKASDTLEEIEWYAKEALILRNEHKELAEAKYLIDEYKKTY